jgi:predicted extracellular nuclease
MFVHRTVCRALVLVFAVASSTIPALAAGKIVISQLYGGGGNTGATYKNDFIELYNSGDTAVNVTGWSVQYASATGTTWQVTNLSGTIQPGKYYLVQELQGAGGTTNLPTPDATGTIPMSATAGKVALANSTTGFIGACPTGAMDFVAFGSTNCSEGSATGTTSSPTLANTTAAIRIGGGCQDTDNNKNDFPTTPTSPTPRNSSSSSNACLSITSVSAAEGNSGTTSFNFVAQLNVAAAGAVSFNAGTADVTASAGSDYTALTNAPFSISAGSTSVTVPVLVNGDTTVEPDETFTVTLSSISGASPVAPTLSATGTILNDDSTSVTLSFSPTTIPDGTEGVNYSQTLTVTNGDTCTFSNSGALPPGVHLSFTGTNNQVTLSGVPRFSGSSSFTISATCADGSTSQPYTVNMAFACESGVKTSTPVHDVQGNSTTSPIAGQVVEVEGIVVGAFQSTSQLRGFYLQEPDASWDPDPMTSEGVFIFDNGVGATVNIGDRVPCRARSLSLPPADRSWA